MLNAGLDELNVLTTFAASHAGDGAELPTPSAARVNRRPLSILQMLVCFLYLIGRIR
jgi:hypothetical protein